MTALSDAKARFKNLLSDKEEMTLEEFLGRAKEDSSLYLSPQERLLKAIGEPVLIDTKQDERLSRIFGNRVIRQYPAFSDFYGLESVVENIVGFLKHAAQGLEERKQVLYLLGPVGGGKSSLAERLKLLMEKEPFYAIKDSPVFESPLGFFNKEDSAALGIPERYLGSKPSPWALKRLQEFNGDVSKFKVVKLFPSQLYQIAVSRIEPGDESNQDISTLVGKVDISKLHKFTQSDADAYSFSGGLNRGNRGVAEMVEMFKASIKTLHPLLTATQEGTYNGTEAISGIPFEGVILAHSNESEWVKFKNNKNNEAFLDRIYLVSVPYCLQVTEETKIYEKLLSNSLLKDAPCAPQTLRLLAQFSVLSRLKPVKTATLVGKMRTYDGENVRETIPGTKMLNEYREEAGPTEGMEGISTRFAFKILSKVFNMDPNEIAADPLFLFATLHDQITKEQFPEEKAESLFVAIEGFENEYRTFLDTELKKAYVESYPEYGQNVYDKYLLYADSILKRADLRDSETGMMIDQSVLLSFLEEIEKPAHVVDPREFRNQVVLYAKDHQLANKGKNPAWTHDKKIKKVIEKKIFASLNDTLPIMAFTKKQSAKEQQKHDDFVSRMIQNGYTKAQVQRIVSWYAKKGGA